MPIEMDEIPAVTPNNIPMDYLNKIIKANEQQSAKIDELLKTNPKLSKDYEEFSNKQAAKNAEQTRQEQNDLVSMIFDSIYAPGTTLDDKGFKWIDNAIGRRVPYGYLRKAGRTEVPRMIKNLRRYQLTEYGELAARKQYGKEVGFCLEWIDPQFKPTKDQEKRRIFFEKEIHSNFFYPANASIPSFIQFLGQAYEDYFDYDDITFKIIRDGMNNPIALQLEDPTIYKATVPKVKNYLRYDRAFLQDVTEKLPLESEPLEYDYILRFDGQTKQAFTRDNLYKSHFFVQTDSAMYKTGFSIMEQAINTLSIILNATAFNASNFSNNRTPTGLLAITGGVTNQLQIEKLKKLFWAQMTGASSQHKIPIVGLPEKGDAKWVSVHGTAKEMEFYVGLTLFYSIVYALSGTDPNESSLANFHDTQKTGGLTEENKDGIYRKSKDTGLVTFTAYVKGMLNIPMTDGSTIWEQATGLPVRIGIKGIAEENMDAKMKVNAQRLKVDASYNEIRKENGQPEEEYLVETPNGKINIYDVVGLVDQSINSFIKADVQAVQQEKQQQQAMEQQQLAAEQQANAEQEQYSAEDESLIQQYGSPQE
jgi:hypothetical protein